MMRIANLALFTALLIPSMTRAQLASGISIGGGLDASGGVWMRESRLSPALHFASSFAAARFDGSLRERAGSFLVDRAVVDGALASPALGVFRLSADGSVEKRPLEGGAVARVMPALSAKIGRTGMWVGSAHEQRLQPRLRAGAWTIVRSAVLSLSSETQQVGLSSIRSVSYPDSIKDAGDSSHVWTPITRVRTDTVRNNAVRWSQLEARLDWSFRRLVLSGTLAASRPYPDRGDSSATHMLRWGRVNAALMLNDRLSLFAAAGTHPRAPRSTGDGARFATLGVRFSPVVLLREPLPSAVRPAASSFAATRIESGLYKLVLRVASARSVQLSGDFNGWNAVTMTETAPNVWEVSLPLAPGTHRVNVRVDGDRWTAPPGLPSVEDEFNGRVGILVIR